MTAPVAMVKVCTEFDASNVCTLEVWMPYAAAPLPALSLADAKLIGGAIGLLWAGAYIFRVVRRALNT